MRPSLRALPPLKLMPDFETPIKPTYQALADENEQLRQMAARYWVLRDAINWQIKAGKRMPRCIRLIFDAQMAEIDAELQQ